MKKVSFYIIHGLLYETKVANVTKLLKTHVKIRSFLWVIVNKSRRNIFFVTKLHSLGYDMNAMLKPEVLYLQKQPLVFLLQSTVLY